MNDNSNVENSKIGQEKTLASASAQNTQEETKVAEDDHEKAEERKQGGKTENDRILISLPKIDFSKIDKGAIFAGIDYLCKEAKNIDSKVSNYTGGVLTKLSNYIGKAIENYRGKGSSGK